MKKLEIYCQINQDKRIERNIATYFQGWLMDRLDSNYAEYLHDIPVTPYSISSTVSNNEVKFIINMLTKDAEEHIQPILMDNDLKYIELISSQQVSFRINKIEEEELNQEGLARIFYSTEETNSRIKVFFDSPTSFKSQGEYLFYPDIRLIIQSLMKQYNFYFEQTLKVDKDFLYELVEGIKIVNYRLSSTRYGIHTSKIPGFTGEIVLSLRMNTTMKNYLMMLLKMGEYTGVGIKTSMGMGAIRLGMLGGQTWTKSK
ncbi:CRISPR-associated endoribonuclease Cas6 [Fundicoccus culcitae]|uniref:CRISPR-associated endoribonuclease Cas6 n=1 Tax=Fundicoccus culcitae TaxID=2969821 RepID=A0ABY5P5H3_9LACT|nr:CRISPR-associated endoribonuclease Cas6 [Fundicoccus culcitae]UUX33725.1 CRISPR-associated endoribonuclease Cas6 [Fundicoccus culcitae]